MDWFTLTPPNPDCSHPQSRYYNTLLGLVVHWCPDCAGFLYLRQCGAITSTRNERKCCTPSNGNATPESGILISGKSEQVAGGNQKGDKTMTYREQIRNFKREIIQTTLKECNGNQCKAARRLGIHRNTLNREMVSLGVELARRARLLGNPVHRIPVKPVSIVPAMQDESTL
jgi:hypothetical protein